MVSDRIDLDARVASLERAIADLERRLGRLESGASAASSRDTAATAKEPPVSPGAVPPGTRSRAAAPAREPLVPLAGRALLVLAGAFLIRAVTESGALPQMAGTYLGVGYALVWLGFAYRAAGRGRPTAALFHGLAATAVVYPLLWEATVKFRFLHPVPSAVTLAVVTGIGLIVAWSRGVRSLGWLLAGGTGILAFVLAFSTRTLVPFVAVQALLGVSLLWTAYTRGWFFLGVVAAAIVDFTLLVLTGLVILDPESRVLQDLRPDALHILQFGVVIAYAGSIWLQVVRRGRRIHALEILQSVILLVVGLGGAIWIAMTQEEHPLPVGLAVLGLGVGNYAAAFAFADRRLERRRNFIFFSTLGLFLVLLGLGGLLKGALRSETFAILAVAMMAFGALRGRATLSLHGSLYALAAAFFSGLVATSVGALFTGAPDLARWARIPILVALAAILIAMCFPIPLHGRTWGRLSRTPHVILFVLAALALGGMAVSVLAAVLGGADRGLDPATLAALRTGVLSLSILLLAWGSRFDRWRELGWLVYPWLVIVGLKLVLEDLRAGRSVTLFVSLALFGLALILAPRLRRGGRAESLPSGSGDP